MAPPFVYDDLESRISRRARIIAVTVFVADFAVLAANAREPAGQIAVQRAAADHPQPVFLRDTVDFKQSF